MKRFIIALLAGMVAVVFAVDYTPMSEEGVLGTDIPVSNGGTGASTFTDGGVLLGSGTDALTAMAVLTDGQVIVGDGTTDPVAESGATLRTSIGVGTTDTPQFTGVEVGAATDTSLLRASAGDINIEGNIIYRAGGTDVPVADGGTGLSAGTSGGILAYTATGTLASSALLAQYGIVLGGGAGAVPATLAASANTGAPLLSAGNAANPAYGPLNLAGGATIVSGDLPVADGGTGLSSGTSGGILAYTASGTLASSALLTQYGPLIGGGAGVAPSAIAVGTDNQVLCGATGVAPSFRALADADIPDTITASSYVAKTDVIGSVSMSVAFNNATNGVIEMQLKTEAGANPGATYLADVWMTTNGVYTVDSSEMDLASSITCGEVVNATSTDAGETNEIWSVMTDGDGKISWAFISSNAAFTNTVYCSVGGVVLGTAQVEIPGTP